ncbi:hypothetical protein M422DRAFT_243188 [Sphaerobolus stellatus SS14]|nr:hypothetical protein M422DRAFT_243188 [Sphaerobolus stellatus SS14]
MLLTRSFWGLFVFAVTTCYAFPATKRQLACDLSVCLTDVTGAPSDVSACTDAGTTDPVGVVSCLLDSGTSLIALADCFPCITGLLGSGDD